MSVRNQWSRVSRRTEIAWLLLALPLTFCLGFSRLFFAGDTLTISPDNTYQLVPIFSFLSKQLVHGEFPYWMNTVFGGISMFNDPEMSLLYPFYFLKWDIFNGPVAAMTAIHWITVGHLFVLYVNSYVLLRCLRLAPTAAYLGASVFAISANSDSYAWWITIVAAYSWLPLALAATVMVLDRRHSGWWVIAGIVAFSLLTLASPSQPLIHAVYLVAIFTSWRFAGWMLARDYASMQGAGRDLLIMTAVTLLLSGPAVIPAYLNLGNMIRFIGDFPPVIGNVPMPLEATLAGQMSPAELASVLLPLHAPTVIGNWFLGPSVVFLALIAIARGRGHWTVAPFAFVTLYFLASAMGSHLGFAQFNHHLPLLGMFREPPRHIVLFTLGASTLAAFGFEYLTTAVRDDPRRLLKWPCLAATCLFAVLVAGSFGSSLSYAGLLPASIMVGIIVLVVGLVRVGARMHDVPRTAIFTVAAGIVVATTVPSARSDGRPFGNDFALPANLASHRALAELSAVNDVRTFRTMFEGDVLKPGYWAMNATYYGLRSLDGFKNPLPDARQFNDVTQLQAVPNYNALLGAKFYLCTVCDRVPAGYRFDRKLADRSLFTNDDALPHALVVGRVAGIYDTPEEFIAHLRTGFDLQREVFVDRKAVVANLAELINAPVDATTAVLSPEGSSLNLIAMSVTSNHRAIVMLNEYFTDTWKASVDGVSVDPFRVNLNQIGVVVGPGTSRVVFEYRPTVFVWLLRVQLLSFVVLGGGVVVYAGLGFLRSKARHSSLAQS